MITEGSEAVEGGAEGAQVIGIAEAAARGGEGLQAASNGGFSPNGGEVVGFGSSGPGAGATEGGDFDLSAARGGAGEGVQSGFGLGENVGVVGADFEFDCSVVGNAVEHGAALDVGDVDGEVLVRIGEGSNLGN